jgi:hypothetical protein
VRAYYQEWYDKNYQKLVESGMSGTRAPFSVSSFVTCSTIVLKRANAHRNSPITARFWRAGQLIPGQGFVGTVLPVGGLDSIAGPGSMGGGRHDHRGGPAGLMGNRPHNMPPNMPPQFAQMMAMGMPPYMMPPGMSKRFANTKQLAGVLLFAVLSAIIFSRQILFDTHATYVTRES